MSNLADLGKRLVLGRALRSGQLGQQLLPKRVALPVFASDPLSSVAYAPEKLLAVLAAAGAAGYAYAPLLGTSIAVVLATVVASYRLNVRAYTSGGGDFEVATTNLGTTAGLTVASALLVDYVLTVAVSVSAGAANIAAAIPLLTDHQVSAALLVVAVLAVMNLRGVRESGITFAIPTYAFVAGMLVMIAYGFVRLGLGTDLQAPSADFELRSEGGQLAGLAFLFLLLRAFASGSAALTGVEAIANGVPAFRQPKGHNAATTLALMGMIAVALFVGVLTLALATGVKVVENPPLGLVGAPADYEQRTALAQVAFAVFSNFRPGFYYIAVATTLILVLAANTAFNGFPVLGSILARNRYLPRQLHTRGDRLAYSNGIVMLALFAGVLIYAFDASVTRLIELYIIGVFVSFTTGQTGMVRHWTRLLASETDPAARRRMQRSRVVNGFGALVTGVVLIVVLATKFLEGAWIVVVAMAVIFAGMKGIRRHYDTVATEVTPNVDEDTTLPGRNRAIILVSQIHKPTLRALAYARATRPFSIDAVSVAVDREEAEALEAEWDSYGIQVPLTVLDSPYREITRPVLDYVRRVRRRSPRDVVTVFIPEYVLGRWWEQLLHNQSALRLKGRLLFQPGVMVTSVPWQLSSSERRRGRPEPLAPGASRRPFGDVGERGPSPGQHPENPLRDSSGDQ